MAIDRKTTAHKLKILQQIWGEKSIEAVVARLAADAYVMHYRPEPSVRYTSSRKIGDRVPFQVFVTSEALASLLALKSKWRVSTASKTLAKIIEQAPSVDVCEKCATDERIRYMSAQRTRSLTASLTPAAHKLWDDLHAHHGLRYKAATAECLIARAHVEAFGPHHPGSPHPVRGRTAFALQDILRQPIHSS